MNIKLSRDHILKPLQTVSSVVERRQSSPILSNLLMTLKGEQMTLTGTDLEVEMIARLAVTADEDGEITLPARKFLDICKTLPDGAEISLSVSGDKVTLKSGRSRFTLSTLPATEFPNLEPVEEPFEFSIPQKSLKRLIEKTQFSMAQQDVRYYLNGLMLELQDGLLLAVATDGHRLAMSQTAAEIKVPERRQIIVPRKGVQELARLIEDSDSPVRIQIGKNHIRVELPDISFTSKLIDGKFPDYQQVIPPSTEKVIACDRATLHQAFTRTSVLSNEKYRGMRLSLDTNMVKATVHNPEQEEAEEELEVNYNGDQFEIGFNVSYLLDALSAIDSNDVHVYLTDANHSCLIQGVGQDNDKYVVMPMRL
ncbi:MAG: DNA polymerase III subunit beta [Gammaproteobacteria bacterium]|nr:DNA polymerase III subunit beta [Gammaproteobacteria bacterium]MDH5654106.1 DNA polymerase III subunit beta [Gammaproteobacteria bacterium]